jgi:hypothetical protein
VTSFENCAPPFDGAARSGKAGPRCLAWLAAAGALLCAAPARADDDVSGSYDVKFEESGSTCNPPPVALRHGKLTIEVKKGATTVNTDLVPQMVGALPKDGAIEAKTLKLVGTTVAGLSGRYSVKGRVDGGNVTVVLVADYVRQDTNKPYCSQAWNVSGSRMDAGKK